MLKKENGLGILGIIILIAFICAVIIGFYYIYTKQKDRQKDNDIKSNMLLIQGACSVLYENCVMNKTEDQLIGTKISQIEENEEINKDIINEFKNKNIITEEQYEKYYVLTDGNLSELKVDVKNEADSYYIICYETEEVIITAGYNDKYKLSDITPKENVNSEELAPKEEPTQNAEENLQPEQTEQNLEEQKSNTEEG